jgi:hypothetical protein
MYAAAAFTIIIPSPCQVALSLTLYLWVVTCAPGSCGQRAAKKKEETQMNTDQQG